MRIAPLSAEDLPAYRALMLHAHEAAADAFTTTAEERAAAPERWWLSRIAPADGLSMAFGAFEAPRPGEGEGEGEALVGSVALAFPAKAKTRHKALLLGLFVREDARGRGAGAALLAAAIDAARARPGVLAVNLTVTEGNGPAIRLYERAGFRAHGTEPMAIATPGGLRGQVLMGLELAGAGPSADVSAADPRPLLRVARCSCGQLRAEVRGPVRRVSVCHCLACQRRTGSVFGTQARFAAADVRLSGQAHRFARTGDGGGVARFAFCPQCGATVAYTLDDDPDVMAIPVGAFADPAFPPPGISVYEERRHPWVGLPSGIDRID